MVCEKGKKECWGEHFICKSSVREVRQARSQAKPRVGPSKERVLNGPAASQSDRRDQVTASVGPLLLL